MVPQNGWFIGFIKENPICFPVFHRGLYHAAKEADADLEAEWRAAWWNHRMGKPWQILPWG